MSAQPQVDTGDPNAPPNLIENSDGVADAIHEGLRNDSSIQFDFPQYAPEPPEAPSWLMRLLSKIGEFIAYIGDGWRYLLWIVVSLVILALALWLFPVTRNAIIAWYKRLKNRTKTAEQWTPTAVTARALLDEADQLAASGQFDAAVRLLLHRSIEDIEQWRGQPLPASYTARDIRAIETLNERARTLFSTIVEDVERSLFAGQMLNESDWLRARQDYAGFALAKS